MNTVIKFQKRAARYILEKPIETPLIELFAELKWMIFPERVMYQKAIPMYKVMHLHQKIYCMFQNQQLNFTETASLIQDLKYGTPFQTVSEKQLLYSSSDIFIG